eukprot:m.806957 g.806957  ORF g.806957 m.806957 type:complete len:338 (-) comp59297_c0_seq48:37-1050(-)
MRGVWVRTLLMLPFSSALDCFGTARTICCFQIVSRFSFRYALFASSPLKRRFINDPATKDDEELQYTCLREADKICDIIADWESKYRLRSSGYLKKNSLPKFVFKKRIWSGFALGNPETEAEKLLFCYHVNDALFDDRFFAPVEDAIQLAALLAQIEWGDRADFQDLDEMLPELIARFMPPVYFQGQNSSLSAQSLRRHALENSTIERAIGDAWMSRRGQSINYCVREYIAIAERWPFARGTTVHAEDPAQPGRKLLLAFLDNEIAVLDASDFKLSFSIAYSRLKTFSGTKGQINLLVSNGGKQFSRVFNVGKVGEPPLPFHSSCRVSSHDQRMRID